MVAPTVFVIEPPAKSEAPSSTVARMLPELMIVPAAPWTMMPSSPPVIEPVLVTVPPLLRPTP
jgi:hypothetical protein